MKGKGEWTFLTYFWSNTRPIPNGGLSFREGHILVPSINTGGPSLGLESGSRGLALVSILAVNDI